MTGRVLSVRHVNRSGYPVGQAEYGYDCGCAGTVWRQMRHEYGAPRVVADEAVYTLHDGGTERHRLVWRDGYVCAGAACVQGAVPTETAGTARTVTGRIDAA